MPHRSAVRTILVFGAAVALTAPLQGCLLAAVGGAGVAGGYMLNQERSVQDTARDAGITAVVAKSWSDYNYKLHEDLNPTVYEGRVLITGVVPSEEWRQEAVKRAWRVDGVKEVYDEIQVGPEQRFFDDVRDTKISTELRTRLLGDSDVKSLNYTVTTVNGVVYIIGSARSQAELDIATNHARNISGVRRVVSYVRIRTGEPTNSQAGGAPPPRYAPPPAPVAAPMPNDAPSGPPPGFVPTPRQSIEVTPLQ